MIKKITEKDIQELKAYIKGLEDLFNKQNTTTYRVTTLDEEYIIEGYEKIARSYIDFLNMNEPKRTMSGKDIINYNNDAELCAIWNNFSHLNSSIKFLKRVKARMERLLTNPEEFTVINEENEIKDAFTKTIDLLTKFHSLAKSVTLRRKGKQVYEFNDEYDVQDLLFCLVKSHFKNADREDPATSVGKGYTVIDIVIPEHNIVVEIKMIKDNAKEKEIVEQLKIDFESYHTHKACKKLIAFIYDPNTVIKDPDKIINDLSGKRTKGDKSFEVYVVINPK
jgi:hypothetical protein